MTKNKEKFINRKMRRYTSLKYEDSCDSDESLEVIPCAKPKIKHGKGPFYFWISKSKTSMSLSKKSLQIHFALLYLRFGEILLSLLSFRRQKILWN